MTTVDEFAIEKLESKLDRLMEAYTQLIKENQQLRTTIVQQSVELDNLQKQHTLLGQSYTDLKLAKAISVEDLDIQSAQKRLAKLVREVEQCIALLNAI
jgi:chromosome segregation ATPase